MNLVSVSRHGTVIHAVLMRESKRNAINIQMRDELFRLFELASIDGSVSGVLLSGAGAGFCSGADISEFTRSPEVVKMKENRRQRDLFGSVAEVPCILVAIMHGFAFGSGLELALLCDIRTATPGTRFRLPEVELGIMPPAGGTQTLSRTVGAGRALDMILGGREVTTPEAAAMGLLNEVVAQPEVARGKWSEILNQWGPREARRIKASARGR